LYAITKRTVTLTGNALTVPAEAVVIVKE